MSPVADSSTMTRNATTMASDTIATRSARRRFHASVQSPGETACGTSKGIASLLLELHPRIDRLVHQVGQQIEDHRRHRDVHGNRLDNGKITTLHGENH